MAYRLWTGTCLGQDFEEKCYSKLFGDFHENFIKSFSSDKILQIRETQLHERKMNKEKTIIWGKSWSFCSSGWSY